MADLYIATDAVGNRYTLRILRTELQTDHARSRQFAAGCRALSELNHPNIVHLYEKGKHEGALYAVLQYLDGWNLKERILRRDIGLKTHRLHLLLGMAASLSHVHEHRYLHLDFKPENIMVSDSYNPTLIDFDLAIPRPEKPRRLPAQSGTLAYWAPEQIAREPVDERADVFAFGVTAYEMLTGKKPVTGSSREEILAKYANFNDHLVPLITDRASGIPTSIAQTITNCLEMNVDRRYPTMSLVVRDLQI